MVVQMEKEGAKTTLPEASRTWGMKRGSNEILFKIGFGWRYVRGLGFGLRVFEGTSRLLPSLVDTSSSSLNKFFSA